MFILGAALLRGHWCDSSQFTGLGLVLGGLACPWLALASLFASEAQSTLERHAWDASQSMLVIAAACSVQLGLWGHLAQTDRGRFDLKTFCNWEFGVSSLMVVGGGVYEHPWIADVTAGICLVITMLAWVHYAVRSIKTGYRWHGALHLVSLTALLAALASFITNPTWVPISLVLAIMSIQLYLIANHKEC